MPTLRLRPEFENALRTLPGVQAASVVTAPDRTPTEVHVLARPGKAPKQLVRDVQSLALAQYDLDIDHRIVSIVQIAADEAGSVNSADPPRLRLAALSVRTADQLLEAEVTLAAGERTYAGRAAAAALGAQRARAIAGATLDALAGVLGHPCAVESSTIASTGERSIALTVLAVGDDGGERLVSGSAVVREDPDDATARSVLDALNRLLGH
jgi:hypothetical protein